MNYKNTKENGVRNEAIRGAFNKGYRVSECGTKVQYRDRERKLQTVVTLGKPYHRFTVNHEGRTTNILVHRLQAYQKYKTKVFHPGIVVRHKNDNSRDNSKTNILIGTQKENAKDRERNKRNNCPF